MSQVDSHGDPRPDSETVPAPVPSLGHSTGAVPVVVPVALTNGGSGSHLSLAPASCPGPGSGLCQNGGSRSGSGSGSGSSPGSGCGAGLRSGGWCCSLVSALCRLVSFVVDGPRSEKRRDSDPTVRTERLLDTDVSQTDWTLADRHRTYTDTPYTPPP